MTRPYDLGIVGAGIVGLAHAYAAARLGKRVVVFDRDARANGASVRNFGFITVTGQQQGECWRRAMRSRDVWTHVAGETGIRIEQTGLLVAARRPEAVAVLEAFLKTDMGRQCRMLTPSEAKAAAPGLRQESCLAALESPHEIRVESRDAIPLLARWLEETFDVTFMRQTHVQDAVPPHIRTTAGTVECGACIVCPGDDFLSLYPERIAAYGLTRCKLHMMKVDPGGPGWRTGPAIMADLSLARYLGYAELPEAAALARRLEAEQPEALEHGVHLIVTQGADGGLIVGDSHHYGDTPPPFGADMVDDIILEEMTAVLSPPAPRVIERWQGVYASADDRLMLVDQPSDDVRIVIITSGTGASTSFAIAEEVVGDLYGVEIPD